MALNIKRAQAIKICDFCQEGSIKWRCIDCDRCLCQKCKSIHLRVPVTALHQIVPIATPLQDVQKKIFTENIPCKDHPRKMTCLFCRSCDSLICPDCVSSSHKKHNFDSVESALVEKLEYLRGIHEQIDANLKLCESKNVEIMNLTPKYNAVFNESVSNIKEREQKLINAIRKHSKALLNKAKNKRSQVNSILSQIQLDVKNKKKNLEDRREELNTILSSSQGGVIFKTNMTIKNEKFDSLPNQIEQFVPQTESPKTIREYFGSFQSLSIPTIHVIPKMELKVITALTTDLPYIGTLVTLDTTSAWISCFNKHVIRKINIQSDTMTISQKGLLQVYDMALTSSNEPLLSVLGKETVKMMKTSGEVVVFQTVAPLLPRGLHVTKDNDVIVGVKEPGNPFTTTDKSQRALIVFDMSGKQKQKYQYDRDGQRLFTLPEVITTNSNQDILVVDSTSVSTGRVVTLDRKGNLKWFYEGHSEVNASRQFNPRGIVTTTQSHIIISDCASHVLHVLSRDGDILTCNVLGDMGILRPLAIDIDNDGRLWVGCDTDDEQTGAKLHIVEFIA